MSSLDAVRARFARNEGLPFADILTEASIREVLNEHGVLFRDRVFSPVTTIWGFLSQVLSEDHSCRDAVSRINAHRAANGVTVCSPNTASYCDARSRILTGVLADALFDDYFIACELCQRNIDIVARAQYVRTGSWAAESRPDGDILVWQRPNKPHGMAGEKSGAIQNSCSCGR